MFSFLARIQFFQWLNHKEAVKFFQVQKNFYLDHIGSYVFKNSFSVSTLLEIHSCLPQGRKYAEINSISISGLYSKYMNSFLKYLDLFSSCKLESINLYDLHKISDQIQMPLINAIGLKCPRLLTLECFSVCWCGNADFFLGLTKIIQSCPKLRKLSVSHTMNNSLLLNTDRINFQSLCSAIEQHHTLNELNWNDMGQEPLAMFLNALKYKPLKDFKFDVSTSETSILLNNYLIADEPPWESITLTRYCSSQQPLFRGICHLSHSLVHLRSDFCVLGIDDMDLFLSKCRLLETLHLSEGKLLDDSFRLALATHLPLLHKLKCLTLVHMPITVLVAKAVSDLLRDPNSVLEDLELNNDFDPLFEYADTTDIKDRETIQDCIFQAVAEKPCMIRLCLDLFRGRSMRLNALKQVIIKSQLIFLILKVESSSVIAECIAPALASNKTLRFVCLGAWNTQYDSPSIDALTEALQQNLTLEYFSFHVCQDIYKVDIRQSLGALLEMLREKPRPLCLNIFDENEEFQKYAPDLYAKYEDIAWTVTLSP